MAKRSSTQNNMVVGKTLLGWLASRIIEVGINVPTNTNKLLVIVGHLVAGQAQA